MAPLVRHIFTYTGNSLVSILLRCTVDVPSSHKNKINFCKFEVQSHSDRSTWAHFPSFNPAIEK